MAITIRKSVREFLRDDNDEERQAFIDAMLTLKHKAGPYSGWTYDDYVALHLATYITEPGSPLYSFAHGCPAFLAWHRPYLRTLEKDLQAISGRPDLGLPYWDWAADKDDPVNAPIWRPDFMGGNGDAHDDWRVQTGPFSNPNKSWPLRVRRFGWEPDYDLRRQFAGTNPNYIFPTAQDIKTVLDTTPYETAGGVAGFRQALEGRWHGGVHMWVGGSRGSMRSGTSPNDPVFFLHHSNVDRLWAKWQTLHPNEEPYQSEGPFKGLFGQDLNEKLFPFGVTIKSILDTTKIDTATEGYTYDGKASDA